MILPKHTSGEQAKGKKKIEDNPDWENLSDESSATLGKYKHLRITPDTDIPKPVPVITINAETISTEGNLTTISGASKSGKSAFTGWIIAGAISNDGILNDPLVGLCVAANPTGKAVIHFDTEQSRYKHQRNVKSILYRADLVKNPEYFQSYNIRELDIKEYAQVTGDICVAAFKKFKGVHLIVIDGIADYIKDVNDPEQSNTIVKFFEDLAMKYKTPVVVIVHTNPGSDKERGHLGSQCQRKSESVLIVKQDGDVSYIEGKFLREAGKGKIPKIQFMYDDEKCYHVSCGLRIGEAINKDEEKRILAERIARAVFALGAALKDGQAVEKVMKESQRAEAKAKEYLKTMRAHEMIIQGEDKLWRLNPDYPV